MTPHTPTDQRVVSIRPKAERCLCCRIPLTPKWRHPDFDDICAVCVDWNRKGMAIAEANRDGEGAA